jgi:hypothetical protein
MMNYICKYKTPEGFDGLVIVKTAEKLWYNVGRWKKCPRDRYAMERECACRGVIRLPDEQSEEPCEARTQEAAREHQPSEFFQNRAEGRKGSATQSKIGEPPNTMLDAVVDR